VKVLIPALAFAGALALAGCSGTGEPSRRAKTDGGGDGVPVSVGTVVQKAMPVNLRIVGTGEAWSVVAVRALVAGALTTVHFEEGQDVNQGDLLFTIDPRPFEAQVHQAEANLARDTAQAENAQAQVRRYSDLVKRGISTREQFDSVSTTASALAAATKADQAALDTASLQLQYATIRAPITGRTGSLMVHAGNLVKANDTAPLVVINQVSPIRVNFAVPESSLAEVRRSRTAGTFRVVAEIPDDDGPAEQGTISFIDNTVDPATGTIKLKASFPNANRRLWPGQFVDVVLTLRTDAQATVVDSAAVQTGQQGQYVYVVKADSTVETRPVTVARMAGDETVIAKGLTAGEQVVTDGHLRIVPGRKVTIQNQPTDARRGQS
jgi:membrane fusion protein, multidrug efflux system